MQSVIDILQPVMIGGIQTWNTPASVVNTQPVRALIDTQFGTESPQGEGPSNLLTSEVHIHYRPGIRPRMRLSVTQGNEAGRLLEIDAVINPEARNEELRLICREVTS
jgi:head-tail adaptor